MIDAYGNLKVGDVVVIESKAHKSLGYNGLECTIIKIEKMQGGDVSAVSAFLRPHSNRPEGGNLDFYWPIGDLVLKDDDGLGLDEASILALFKVAPHEHVCKDCGMKMHDA